MTEIERCFQCCKVLAEMCSLEVQSGTIYSRTVCKRHVSRPTGKSRYGEALGFHCTERRYGLKHIASSTTCSQAPLLRQSIRSVALPTLASDFKHSWTGTQSHEHNVRPLMSSFGTLTRSTSYPTVTKIGSRTLQYLNSSQRSRDLSLSLSSPRHPCYGLNRPTGARLEHMENFFISALVRAGSCPNHESHLSTTSAIVTCRRFFHRSRRRETPIGRKDAKFFPSYTLRLSGHSAQPVEVTRQDYVDLVDYYHTPYDTQEARPSYLPAVEDPALPRDNEAKTSRSAENNSQVDLSEDETLALGSLVAAIDDESTTNETIYERYKALPSPRISYLSENIIRRLLHRLSVVERKSEASMIQYMSVIDDVRAAGIPLTSGEWSSAIAFAGRCFVKVSAVEVESALHIWREMEHDAGVKGTNVTFNILFDIAVKAGKFVLAEMILNEMAKRSLRLNRFARVGIIYYHGLRGDGDGVRTAYKDLVEAGEIVDTLVLNCVIAALARAGEPTAAYQVYERMKRMHVVKSGASLPVLDWKESRELGRLLARAVEWYKEDPEKRQMLQDEQSMAPNLRTYLVLVSHYAVRAGELDRVAVLLDEMQFFGVPLHGSMFIALLKGFTVHGGVRYTPWSKARLEGVWSSFQRALDQHMDRVTLGKWMVIWALRAFAKCSGKERTLEVWDQIQERWRPSDAELDDVHKVLHEVLGT